MKTYLLIAGYNYYPARDTGDWVACYDTEEEATDKMNAMKDADEDVDPRTLDMTGFVNEKIDELEESK